MRKCIGCGAEIAVDDMISSNGLIHADPDVCIAHLKTELAVTESERDTANASLDSLRNFLGDMKCKQPVGRIIWKYEDLVKQAKILFDGLEKIQKTADETTRRDDPGGLATVFGHMAELILEAARKENVDGIRA